MPAWARPSPAAPSSAPRTGKCFGRVADRVAEGNMSLLGRQPTARDRIERDRLRNAIATGALITSGRHLQHGDAQQASRNMEVFTTARRRSPPSQSSTCC